MNPSGSGASGGAGASDTTVTNPIVSTVQSVGSGGSAIDTLVSGGTQVVLSGGTAIDTTLVAGGIEIVSAGGSAGGITLSADGTAEIRSGAAATVFGVIVFARPGATVQIGDTANSALSGLTLSGLTTSDAIDLTDVSFVSGATAEISSGNALFISLGGAVYDIGVVGTSVAGDFFGHARCWWGTLCLRPSAAGFFIIRKSLGGLLGSLYLRGARLSRRPNLTKRP